MIGEPISLILTVTRIEGAEILINIDGHDSTGTDMQGNI